MAQHEKPTTLVHDDRRAGSRGTTIAAVIALLVGAVAVVAGITTWPGLVLAAMSVTVDVIILQHLASRRVVIAGTVFGIVLLVAILSLATMMIAGVL